MIPTLKSICLQNLPSLDDIVINEPAMLYVVFSEDFGLFLGNEVQARLLTVLANNMNEIHRDLILKFTNDKNINQIIDSGPYSGESLAFNLARSDCGRELLCSGDLAKYISCDCLNHTVTGRYQGESLALHLVLRPDRTSLLLQEICKFPYRLEGNTLNMIVEKGPHKDVSVAILLASCPSGRLLLRLSNFTLLRSITQASMSCTLSAEGPWKGLSLAFILLESSYGEEFSHIVQQKITSECFNYIISEDGPYFGQSVAHRLCLFKHVRPHRHLLNALSPRTLNHIVVSGGKEIRGTSVALLLYNGYDGSQVDFSHLRALNEECINHVVPGGPFRGKSVAYCLSNNMAISDNKFDTVAVLKEYVFPLVTAATVNALTSPGQMSVALALMATPMGRDILAMDDSRLARAISSTTLNAETEEKISCGLLMASWCHKYRFFEIENFRLLRSLSPQCLNRLVDDGPVRNCSVALELARHLLNELDYLVQDDYRLTGMIEATTLNQVVPRCDDDGLLSYTSVAFLLALTKKGQDAICHDNFRLARMINGESLNEIIPEGERCAGMSLALVLANTSTGREILAHDNYRLASLITIRTLNHIVKNKVTIKYLGEQRGKSVAFCLAAMYRGEENNLLAAHNFNLAKMINGESLNFIVQYGSWKDTSVAFWLSLSNRECLLCEDNRLLSMINSDALNRLVSSGIFASLSTALVLVHTIAASFTSNDYRLARLLSAETLQTVCECDVGNLRGHTVVHALAMSNPKVLCAHDYFLASMISAETINTPCPERCKGIDVALFATLIMKGDIGLSVLCCDDMRLAQIVTKETLLGTSGFVDDEDGSSVRPSPLQYLQFPGELNTPSEHRQRLLHYYRSKFDCVCDDTPLSEERREEDQTERITKRVTPTFEANEFIIEQSYCENAETAATSNGHQSKRKRK